MCNAEAPILSCFRAKLSLPTIERDAEVAAPCLVAARAIVGSPFPSNFQSVSMVLNSAFQARVFCHERLSGQAFARRA